MKSEWFDFCDFVVRPKYMKFGTSAIHIWPEAMFNKLQIHIGFDRRSDGYKYVNELLYKEGQFTWPFLC